MNTAPTWFVLVFWIYTAHGQVHQNVLHGYNTLGACNRDGKLLMKPFDLIKFECREDKTSW